LWGDGVKKPFSCLRSVSARERFLLTPLSRRNKALYLAMEAGMAGIFIVLAVLAGRCIFSGG
jgi:hypothetical protein